MAMNKRIELQRILEEILGSKNVYFQPPETIKMKYPAIVYSRSNIRNTYAGNFVYKQDYAYQVTVIDSNPVSEIVKKVSNLPMCSFSNHFVADGLNHDVFTLFY